MGEVASGSLQTIELTADARVCIVARPGEGTPPDFIPSHRDAPDGRGLRSRQAGIRKHPHCLGGLGNRSHFGFKNGHNEA